jgi:hypothetical protein
MDVRKTLLVARWEFIKTITRRTYVFVLLLIVPGIMVLAIIQVSLAKLALSLVYPISLCAPPRSFSAPRR